MPFSWTGWRYYVRTSYLLVVSASITRGWSIYLCYIYIIDSFICVFVWTNAEDWFVHGQRSWLIWNNISQNKLSAVVCFCCSISRSKSARNGRVVTARKMNGPAAGRATSKRESKLSVFLVFVCSLPPPMNGLDDVRFFFCAVSSRVFTDRLSYSVP